MEINYPKIKGHMTNAYLQLIQARHELNQAIADVNKGGEQSPPLTVSMVCVGDAIEVLKEALTIE